MMHQVTLDELFKFSDSFVSQKDTRQFQRRVKQFFSTKVLRAFSMPK